MSSHDCFEIGRQTYLNKDYYYASLWLRETIAMLNNNFDETATALRIDTLDYLALSVFG